MLQRKTLESIARELAIAVVMCISDACWIS